MKHTKNALLLECILSIIIVLIIVVLFETDILFNQRGIFTGMKNLEFILVSVMELVTIAVIPLSLKFVKIKRIRKYLTEDKAKAAQHLLQIGSVRMFLLCIPMIANAILYYLFMQTTFGYMAIILLLCLCFIFPSSSRCEDEVSSDN
jgi:hypothetical protein